MRGFRNLADGGVDVPAEGLVIVGPNGHGKTSLLEAALYCQVFRSFRSAADRELVKFGADGFRVEVETGGRADGRTGGRVAAGYDARTKAKRISVNGAEAERTADAIGIVRGVVLSPVDVVLVAGGPRERRRFLDLLLALTVTGYVDALARYRRAIKHRLRAGATEIPAWDRMLAERGAVIVAARREWVAAWADRYRELGATLGERGTPALAYQPSVDGDADMMLAALEKVRARDLPFRRAGIGPHRDELRLTLDGKELRAYGSAGQQRTAAIALRMAEAESLGRATDRAVTVCLDDAFAELDADRSARLARLIERSAASGTQVLAAVPKPNDVPAGLAALEVRDIREGRIG